MSKNTIKKNYFYNLIYQVVAIILPIITTPYISRVLGATNIGIYGYTISISAYFILFGSLGVALYGQREIAYYQNDKGNRSKIFFEILLFRIITMSISSILFYFFFVNTNNQYNIYYKILLLELFANAIDISWFFQGLEEFKKTVTRNLIIKIISVILIFVFVKSSNDLIIYFIIYVLSLLIGNFSLWLYLPKYIIKVKIKDLNIKRHIKPTLILFLPQIAVQVYTILDKTMIGIIISDKSEVGFYTQGEKIIKLLLTIITSMGTVMLPRIAFNFSKNNFDKIKEYLNKSFNFVFMLAFPFMFGIISISEKFVPSFFGEGYDKVSLIMSTISPILLFIGLSNVIGMQYLLPTKHQKEYTLSVVVGAVVNFLFNLLLIKNYGAIGAAIGTVIAEFTVTFIQFLSIRKEFNLFNIIKFSLQYLISAIIMFVILLAIRMIPVSNILSIIIQVIVGFIVYFGLLLLLKNEFIFEYLKLFVNKLKLKGRN